MSFAGMRVDLFLASKARSMSDILSSRPLAVDLFAGAGGLSLGFEQAGFDVVAAVESDPVHCAVHGYNFPSTAVICDRVEHVTAERIRQAAGAGNRQIEDRQSGV